MAVEWYLLDGANSLLTGACCDSTSFLEENFADSLDSSLATDVELYNYDLSVCVPVRAIVQNTVQDTKLKTQSRQLLVPIGTCKSGMYFKYKNRFWLIVGLVDDNKAYEKAIVIWCNHLLTWINDRGEIIQRWSNVSSASQYNNGETYTDNYRTRTDQLMVLTPNDDESLILGQGKRFIIDQRCKVYERNLGSDVLVKTDLPVCVYRLTRADTVLFDYQDSGFNEFMVYQDEQRDTDGYYVINGKGYWLCQEPENESGTNPLSCSITYESNVIYNGLEAGEFTANFFDKDGNKVEVEPFWEINCDFIDSLNVSYVDNTVLISVNDKKLINKSFELVLRSDGYEPTTIIITIKAFL